MRCRRSDLSAVAVLLFAVGAEAGVRRFDMTTDASSNSEGEIELEGWLDFGRPQAAPSAVTNGMAWLGARFGLLDNVELAGFLVLEKTELAESVGDDTSGLMMWVTELRWRFAEVGAWPIDLFLQGQLLHWFEARHPTQFRFTLGASKNIGRLLLGLNVSYWGSPTFLRTDGTTTSWHWLDLSLGASFTVVETDGSVPSISLGVEAWSLIRAFGFDIHNHHLMGGGAVVGPTLALARGRLWLTGHLGVPVYVNGSGFSTPTPLVGRIMLGINL